MVLHLLRVSIFILCISGILDAEWQSYRCVITTEVRASGLIVNSVSDMVCQRKNGSIWQRIHAVKPEDKEYVAVIRETERETYFPLTETLVKAAPAENDNSGFLTQVQSLLSRQEIEPNKPLSIDLKNIPEAAGLPCRFVTFIRSENGGKREDRFSFANSTRIPVGTLVGLFTEISSLDQKFLMPTKLTYSTMDKSLNIVSTYSAYRINEPVPEETFYLGHDK